MRYFVAAWLLLHCGMVAVAQVSTEPLRVSEGVMQALLVHKVRPQYPTEPSVRIRGTVVLRAVIGKEGDVENLQLVSGNPMLVGAAIDAVRQWKYRPYLLNGIPATVETAIHVDLAPPEQSAPQGNAPETISGTVEVPSETVQGLIVRKVAPLYPPLARQARIQGTVVLTIVISKDGDVRDTKLVSGHPMLAPAAIEAVKQWRYKPYIADNQPLELATTVQIKFMIAGGPDGEVPRARADWHLSLHGPQFMRVSEDVMRGLLDEKVDPEYPADAKEKHIEGTVVLNVDVDDDGNVGRVELVSGHPVLAAAAMDAVLQWKYRPFVSNGAPMAVETTVQVKFALTK